MSEDKNSAITTNHHVVESPPSVNVTKGGGFNNTEVSPNPGGFESMEDELYYYKQQTVIQDIMIFEMRALLQSGKGFSNILKLDSLLENFMAVVCEKYGAVNSTVLLHDDLDSTCDYYQIKAFSGIDEFFVNEEGNMFSLFVFKCPKDNGLLWQIIRQGNVFSVRDLEKDPRFEVAWKRWNLEVLQSDIWCPLIKSGKVLGILTLGEKEDGTQIREDEYPFLQELASIAATNIDSTLKYEKNQRILTNIQILYDINQQLANVNDFKRLCIETLATAVNAVNAQKGNLMLFNKETGKLEIKVVWGDIPRHTRDDINNGLVETKTFSLGEGVAGECAAQRVPIRKNDEKNISQVGKNTVFCICSVPLLHGDEVIGVMNMTNRIRFDKEGGRILDPIGRYTEEDVALLLGLADQAAVNLHKCKLYSKSITDQMTGLYNSSHFELRLRESLGRAVDASRSLCLAIADIDHFKDLNDKQGHKAGDEVLKMVARVLESCLRNDSEDMAFRYGGDEFCCIMPNTEPEEASTMMEEFRLKVQDLNILHDYKDLGVTLSVGIASFPHDTMDGKSLFKKADECLYTSKENGRNQVIIYYQGLKLRYGESVNLDLLKKVITTNEPR